MYVANEKRYDKMQYNRLGKSGLKLPAVSLGFWHNFGDNAQYSNMSSASPHSTTASRILTWQIITVRRPAARKRISAKFLPTR